MSDQKISKRLAKNKEGILHPRSMCYACRRPTAFCLCNLVPKFRSHCNLLLLQHPHEKKKYHSTSKILLNAIQNSMLISGVTFEEQDVFSVFPKENGFLLYPGPDALDITEVTFPHESTLIAIDGTWVEARKIMYRNPFLRALKKISFKEQLNSKYHIRKQPKEYCLSTLESIGYAMKKTAVTNEQIDQYNCLFQAFDKMVEQQLAFFPRNQR